MHIEYPHWEGEGGDLRTTRALSSVGRLGEQIITFTGWLQSGSRVASSGTRWMPERSQDLDSMS